jgi:hypothetical protein
MRLNEYSEMLPPDFLVVSSAWRGALKMSRKAVQTRDDSAARRLDKKEA